MNIVIIPLLIALFQPAPPKQAPFCKTLAIRAVESIERLYQSKAEYSADLVTLISADIATGNRVWSVTAQFNAQASGKYLVTTREKFLGWPCVVTQIQYIGNHRR